LDLGCKRILIAISINRKLRVPLKGTGERKEKRVFLAMVKKSKTQRFDKKPLHHYVEVLVFVARDSIP
jgi:hypothetical protein